MTLNSEQIRWDNLVQQQVNLWKARDVESKKPETEFENIWDRAHLTISREYGARGFKIGEDIAEKIGWQCYSRQVVEYVSETAKLRHQIVERFDEKLFKRSLGDTIFNTSSYTHDKHYRHLVQVVLSIAKHGKAVIVGRGGSFITDNTDGMHVRLIAPLEYRVKRYMIKNECSHKKARKYVEMIDERRASFVKMYFQKDINDVINYDLVINVEHYLNDTVANIIIAAMEAKFSVPKPAIRKTTKPLEKENV